MNNLSNQAKKELQRQRDAIDSYLEKSPAERYEEAERYENEKFDERNQRVA